MERPGVGRRERSPFLFQCACSTSSCGAPGFFNTQLLQCCRVSRTQLPQAPTSVTLLMKGFLWDTSLWIAFPEGCFSASSTRAESQGLLCLLGATLTLSKRSRPQSGGTLSRILYLSLRGRDYFKCLFYISLYVYFPLLNLLFLHSPVVVNNSLYKLPCSSYCVVSVSWLAPHWCRCKTCIF